MLLVAKGHRLPLATHRNLALLHKAICDGIDVTYRTAKAMHFIIAWVLKIPIFKLFRVSFLKTAFLK
ncbi:hypothetical protein ACWIUD_10375 [Helicobacter sp. 23-1044]